MESAELMEELRKSHGASSMFLTIIWYYSTSPVFEIKASCYCTLHAIYEEKSSPAHLICCLLFSRLLRPMSLTRLQQNLPWCRLPRSVMFCASAFRNSLLRVPFLRTPTLSRPLRMLFDSTITAISNLQSSSEVFKNLPAELWNAVVFVSFYFLLCSI